MSIEYEIINHLKAHPGEDSRAIAKSIKMPRYRVVLAIARLLWQQRIELCDYSKESRDSHHQQPLYSTTSYETQRLHTKGDVHNG